MDEYLKALTLDANLFTDYYKKSLEKTEQQKFLEQIVAENFPQPKVVADLGCGAGTLSWHFSHIFKDARFYLVDYNDDAVRLAQELCSSGQFVVSKGDITSLDFTDKMFDMVFSAGTLGWMVQRSGIPFLTELVRILKSGGTAFLTTLINTENDTDLFTTVRDHTRASGQSGLVYEYNTYSLLTIRNILEPYNVVVEAVPFHPEIDFFYGGRGIGTKTVMTAEGKRLQMSGGMLLNWAVLIIKKH